MGQIRFAHLFGFESTLGFFSFLQEDGATPISGYISPKLSTLSLVGQSDQVDRIKDQTGEFDSVICSGYHLSCQWTLIPEGATIAEAKESLNVPEPPRGCVVSGLPYVPKGPFVDVAPAYDGSDFGALNVDTSAINPDPNVLEPLKAYWIFEGGDTSDGVLDGKWGLNLTMNRYPKMKGAPVLITA